MGNRFQSFPPTIWVDASFDKASLRKLIWCAKVDDIQFDAYVREDSVPTPIPKWARISILPADGIDVLSALTVDAKRVLEASGYSKDAMQALEEILPLAQGFDWLFGSPDRDIPIIALMTFVSVHGNTVRFDEPKKTLEGRRHLGSWYIPKTMLPLPYPGQIIVRIRWGKRLGR